MLPLLIVWPAVVVLLLLLGTQALLVSGARAHADAAASAGLRAVWEHAGVHGVAVPAAGHDSSDAAVESTARLADAARDAVAASAGGQGWRWWTPGGTAVRSDWCHHGADAVLRPAVGESGWVRVQVSGEVFGPFSALWPGRLDTVHASAQGPVLLHAAAGTGGAFPGEAALADC